MFALSRPSMLIGPDPLEMESHDLTCGSLQNCVGPHCHFVTGFGTVIVSIFHRFLTRTEILHPKHCVIRKVNSEVFLVIN